MATSLSSGVRNIGIFAHVDAGKTTLTERILFQTAAIRTLGRVDQGTAHTDTMEVERRRGISVRAQAACVVHRGVEIRIIDTPGHVDFSGEVEGALLALDGAVLVVSAVEGVQAQTASVYRALRSLGIPVIAMINKTDRTGADIDRVLGDLERLTGGALDMRLPRAELHDRLTFFDEPWLARMLDGGAPTDEEMHEAIARGVAGGALVPVVHGSALRGIGVDDVLDGIVRWLPAPEAADKLTCVVYRIERAAGQRLLHVRVYGGRIGFGAQENLRIRRFYCLSPEGYRLTDGLEAGDIGMIEGAQRLMLGQWIGEPVRGSARLLEPVLRAQVVPERADDLARLPEVLAALADGQPSLAPSFVARTRTFFVHVNGEIHQEILAEVLRDEHNLPARLESPGVLYRETVRGVGVGKLNEGGSPWYASATLRVSPLPRGSGVVIDSEAPTDDLFLRYQRQIQEAILPALAEGLTGWPVTDTRVTIMEGYGRAINPGSRFGPVIPLALFEALERAGTQLLEPVLAFEAWLDAAQVGDFLYDLSTMRAVWEEPEARGEGVCIRGRVPVATSLRYAVRFAGLTGGRGLWRVAQDGYDPCPEGCGISIPRSTPDPRERGAYMAYLKGLIDG